jgi:hypothetical protein
MRLSLGAAGEVDLVSSDEFHEGIGGLRKLIAPTPKDRSIRKNIPVSTRTAASGGTLLDFGGPPSGTLWVPLWITVIGADDHTAFASATVAVYVGGEAMVLPPLGNLLIPASAATAVPYNQQISSKDTIYAHFGDSVFALVYGGAGDSPVAGVLRVREVHPSNIEELNFLE